MKYPYTSNPITDTLLYTPIWLMSCTYDLGTGVTTCNVDCVHTGWRGIKLQPSVLFQAGWGRRVVPRPPCVRWGAITHGFPQNFLFRPWFLRPLQTGVQLLRLCGVKRGSVREEKQEERQDSRRADGERWNPSVNLNSEQEKEEAWYWDSWHIEIKTATRTTMWLQNKPLCERTTLYWPCMIYAG